MFGKKAREAKSVASASLRMVEARGLKPLTSSVEAGVKSLTRKGAVLVLKTPFIDGCHILMDVHNITPKLAQVSFAAGESQDDSQVSFLGDIVSFNRVEGPEGPRFLVELCWDRQSQESAAKHKAIKRLLRGAKSAPAGGGG